MACDPIPRWYGSGTSGFGSGQVAAGAYVACPGGWTGVNWTIFNDTVGGSAIGINLRFYDASFTQVFNLMSPTVNPGDNYPNNTDTTGMTTEQSASIRWVRMYAEVFGGTQSWTVSAQINAFHGCPEVVAVANTAYVQIMG